MTARDALKEKSRKLSSKAICSGSDIINKALDDVKESKILRETNCLDLIEEKDTVRRQFKNSDLLDKRVDKCWWSHTFSFLYHYLNLYFAYFSFFFNNLSFTNKNNIL